MTTLPLQFGSYGSFGAGSLGFNAAGADADRSRTDFAEILGIADRNVRTAGSDPAAQARETAEQFVAKVFIEPLLAQARAGNTEPPPFGPGPGEKQFASMVDAKRAMDLVRGRDWAIVDRLAHDLMRNHAPGAA